MNFSLNELESPYGRPKYGPPLTNVIHKVNAKWLYNWLKDPKAYDPRARMPNLKLDDGEIKAVMAYLASIADPEPPQVGWEPFLLKAEDEMTDEEWEEMDSLYLKGKAIWRGARCTICHAVEGRGGFVTLGVGVNLSGITGKVNRDWLYRWIRDPKDYFPQTLMPRFRLSDEELRALVEYIMRDYSFMPEEEESEEESKSNFIAPSDPELIEEGRNAIELSRCILCHDIKGIRDILPVYEERAQPSEEFAKLLNDVKCLTCHSIGGRGGDYAPDLTYSGSKLKTEWMIDFLKAPDMIRPLLQQMPKFNLAGEEAKIAAQYIKDNLVRQEVPANILKDEVPTEEQLSEGERLFYEKGCQACHTMGEEGGALGPDLTGVGERLEPGYIFFHLKDPHRANPYAVEPNYGLSDEEAMALTRFLTARGQEARR